MSWKAPRRQRKGTNRNWKKDDLNYDSDDARVYQDVKDPDPTSREYLYDEVDDFHADGDKILLDNQTEEPKEALNNEEEVLGWDDEDSDDELEKKAEEFKKYHRADLVASDDEIDEGDEEEEPDQKAWGKKKPKFYGTDFVGDNILDQLQQEEEEEQVAEEQEALLIQRRLAEALDEQDFGMDILQTFGEDEEEEETQEKEEERVKIDLSKLSKKDKLEILRKESPEFLELVEDYKSKLLEVRERLQPLINKLQEGKISEDTIGATYLQTKYHLYLNYCLNISFYMVMKAKHLPIKNHPVIGRILAYRKLINELSPADEKMKDEIDLHLAEDFPVLEDEVQEESVDDEEETEIISKKRKQHSSLRDESDGDEDSSVIKKKKKKKVKSTELTAQELKALEYYQKMEAKQMEKKNTMRKLHQMDIGDEEDYEDDGKEMEDDVDEEDSKRAITYQISKNKGLISRKKKELRNPRVKNRNKYRKAKIRRKGQVHEVRTEMNRYGGELTGIRAGVVKSIKLK